MPRIAPIKAKTTFTLTHSQPESKPAQVEPESKPLEGELESTPVQAKSKSKPLEGELESKPVQVKSESKPAQAEPESKPVQAEPESKAVHSETESMPTLAEPQNQGASPQVRELRRVRTPIKEVLPGDDDQSGLITPEIQRLSVSSPIPRKPSPFSPSYLNSPSRAFYHIPKRSNQHGGTSGMPIQVDTNHFAITLKDPSIVIFHYDVDIDPDKPLVHMRAVMEKVARQFFPDSFYGYDGRKNLFSKGQLPFGTMMSCNVTVLDKERMRDKEYKVTMKKAQEIKFASILEFMKSGVDKPQIALQALDVILHQPLSMNSSFIHIGRSYFSPPDPRRPVNLGDGLHLWDGFYQSAIIGWRPFLNVDVAHKGFSIEIPVVQIVQEICQGVPTNRELTEFHMASLRDRLCDMKVIYEIPNQPNSKKIYKVNKIVGSALTERFTPTQGAGEITIAKYFAHSKNYRLQYPHLPCLQVGSVAQGTRVPAELCTVLGGQFSNKKMSEAQTAALVKAAVTGTHVRRAKVMDAMRKTSFGGSKLLAHFGVEVADQMERVDARVLEAPSIGYQTREVRVDRGEWRADKFFKCCEVASWAIVNLVRGYRPPNWRAIMDNMPRGAQMLGVSFARHPEEVHEDAQENGRNLRNILRGLKQAQVQLVFVIVPNAGDTYAKVKQVAELEVGILTQCIREKTVSRMNPSITRNILFKLNAKMNGTNHFVKEVKKPGILSKPTIIFGADVTHPSVDEAKIPSVAAVTASFDAAAFKYHMLWNLQDPRQEIIVHLEVVVKTLLLYFCKVNNRKPEHIIFYRDGVSEGQFQAVLCAELAAIKRACASMEQGYNPPVTFLVVQKRHHTRFFPPSPQEGDGSRNNNVRPGTIVDTTITHPTDLDFYLVSHASLQGTARPTKYYRLWDEYNLSDDETEEMTYYLCHLFSRCTRAVSYPAPTYYAHLAAYRGRVYIKNRHLDLNNLSSENQVHQVNPEFLVYHPMYFV